MALAQFSILVTIDQGTGIARNGEVPWKVENNFFREKTIGRKKNAVIMGRNTYEAIPEDHRPLVDRRCVIISRTWKQEHHPKISIYPSLLDALAGLGSASHDEVFLLGGEQLFKEAIRDFLYLCDKIYVTKLKLDYKCDQFFPYDVVSQLPQSGDSVKTKDYVRYTYAPKMGHDEYQYLDLLRDVLTNGETKPNRTSIPTRSLFGRMMSFDLRDRLPVFTTKKVFYDIVIKELLFFLSGKTDTRILSAQSVKIWEGNTSAEYLKANKIPLNEGDMGAGYSHQWRHWGAEYKGCDVDYTGQGIDQIKEVIKSIREDPHSRRHIIMTWNPAQLHQMALPPCHYTVQFNVSGDKKWLDCLMTQRSADMFLGMPFNVTSYALLTAMIAHITNLRPRRLTISIGDAHIYDNHGAQVKKQLDRTPRPFPKLSFREATRIHELEHFSFDSFIIEGYTSWPPITAEMAI